MMKVLCIEDGTIEMAASLDEFEKLLGFVREHESRWVIEQEGEDTFIYYGDKFNLLVQLPDSPFGKLKVLGIGWDVGVDGYIWVYSY